MLDLVDIMQNLIGHGNWLHDFGPATLLEHTLLYSFLLTLVGTFFTSEHACSFVYLLDWFCILLFRSQSMHSIHTVVFPLGGQIAIGPKSPLNIHGWGWFVIGSSCLILTALGFRFVSPEILYSYKSCDSFKHVATSLSYCKKMLLGQLRKTLCLENWACSWCA